MVDLVLRLLKTQIEPLSVDKCVSLLVYISLGSLQ